MSDGPVRRIVIAGGGTAGWLSACYLAAWSKAEGRPKLDITLIEAPDIASIGVGEGTWPTMRETLATIGLDEADFLRRCDASFKQGSRFDGWIDGGPGDRYLHPFTPPPPTAEPAALVAAWKRSGLDAFADAMSVQPALCSKSLAPRQRSMPPYAGAANYGYHLDAAKLARVLREHATHKLDVHHIAARIDGVEADDADGIAAVRTADGRQITGNLFVDCTGLKALLIGDHCHSAWVDRSDVLFNDRALALQIPVKPASPIASQTIATAHEGGWIWDIGLPTRRGIGCVYSSRFVDEERARSILADYVRHQDGLDNHESHPRLIEFPTGHRDRFWKGNCVAIGLSAGFIEPLEASAIVLIELSLRQLVANFPADRARMSFLADRFNALFTLRWERIVEFLKLHYVLGRRDDPYWRAHRDHGSFPPRLTDLLALWRNQPPSLNDLPMAEEMFPAASYQYVYLGMGGRVPDRLPAIPPSLAASIAQIAERARNMAAALPTNRAYLDALAAVPVIAQESAA